jgi:predicted nucleotidyltransferase
MGRRFLGFFWEANLQILWRWNGDLALRQRGFRDRDFLSTEEGFLFCVVGSYHPDDRVISYLKYLPDPSGLWKKGRSRFKRVMQVYTISNLLETFNLLKKAYPQYLFFSQFYNITMTAVPRNHVAEHFKPEKKLNELFRKSHLDPLQKKVIRLVSLLSEQSNVETRSFGVTGSVLLDIHNPNLSDMDITVYGTENSYALKKAMSEAFLTKDLGVSRFGKERLDEWYSSKIHNHPFTLSEARQVYERKWNIGVYEDTLFSVHPIKLEGELTEKYGDKTYCPIKTVTIGATVTNTRDSIFLPALYKVAEVENETGGYITEVVSYEGLYDNVAERGEKIIVRGKLEHVTDNRTGEEYDRVLVGSPEGGGREYIKPLAETG